MTRSIAYCTLIVAAGVIIALSVCAPQILSDKNGFLEKFVGSDLLNILGVILAITLASAGQLHLAFNQIEERHKTPGLRTSRAGVHNAAYFLIFLFLLAVLIMIVKSALPKEEWIQSLVNGAEIFILLWYILILISLTQVTFKIRPELPPKS